jgi:DNA polymerase-4
MLVELETRSQRLSERLERSRLKGRTITVKFKFHDSTIMTKSLSSTTLISDKENIIQSVKTILENALLNDKQVKLLGIRISNFELATEKQKPHNDMQLRLF